MVLKIKVFWDIILCHWSSVPVDSKDHNAIILCQAVQEEIFCLGPLYHKVESTTILWNFGNYKSNNTIAQYQLLTQRDMWISVRLRKGPYAKKFVNPVQSNGSQYVNAYSIHTFHIKICSTLGINGPIQTSPLIIQTPRRNRKGWLKHQSLYLPRLTEQKTGIQALLKCKFSLSHVYYLFLNNWKASEILKINEFQKVRFEVPWQCISRFQHPEKYQHVVSQTGTSM